MAKAIAEAKAHGVTHMIFGDLFLEDVRAYRERQHAGTASRRSFRSAASLARGMIAAGVEAHLSTVV